MSNCPITLRSLALSAGLALTAACASAPLPPPPPPPPPPPVVEAVAYRPLPPPQADYAMNIPRRGPDGQRVTINSGLDENETIWHFRSGWNVAALNCNGSGDDAIDEGYSLFLNRNARALTTANNALDAAFRSSAGAERAGLLAREQHMTMVYNYFSSPSARDGFCDAALAVAEQYAASPSADIRVFSAIGLRQYEAAFERFYLEYEEYERASADWDARYGALYGPSQPGWVAVHGSRMAPGSAGFAPLDQPVSVQTVLDPVTGAAIPLLPLDASANSAPVVQPLPSLPEGG